jgi:hypothetical protein
VRSFLNGLFFLFNTRSVYFLLELIVSVIMSSLIFPAHCTSVPMHLGAGPDPRICS